MSGKGEFLGMWWRLLNWENGGKCIFWVLEEEVVKVEGRGESWYYVCFEENVVVFLNCIFWGFFC